LLKHGGNLRQAAQRYGIPLDEWIDLSTGINPCGWQPKQTVPAVSWQRLPEEGDGLEVSAYDYYGCESLLPVAGSQAAIQALPRLREPGRIGVIHPGYAEHATAWRSWGHEVVLLQAHQIDAAVNSLDVLVIIHPCNPTGVSFSQDQLIAWQQQLAEHDGWLIVDEAFIDPTPEQSLIQSNPQDGLIVLRSLGKFFGLAGVRVGFVYASQSLLLALQEVLGPWTISGPARWIATQALMDSCWQQQQKSLLQQAGERLEAMVEHFGVMHHSGTALFRWFQTPDAESIQHKLAQQGIWVRRFEEPASLRFGLPASELDWQRLETALKAALSTRAVA
jgi:cobalamin biosynthesis protein CobC